MDFKRPTLLAHQGKVRANIARMWQRAADQGCAFRPHFKTHQSVLIGNWFRDYGVRSITVSSLSMAQRFADAGWQDITVAVPVNLAELDLLDDLAGRIKLNVLVDSLPTLKTLQNRLSNPVGLFIEVDTGYPRTGVPAEDTERLDELVELAARPSRAEWKGLLSHAGNSYKARGRAEILNIHRHNCQTMLALRQRYQSALPHRLLLSVGDTPTCSIGQEFEGMDELRPGNFVFYDVMQTQRGSCNPEQIALSVVCPVISQAPDRRQVVVYGGAVHLSKDTIEINGQACYGWAARLHSQGWELLDPKQHFVVSLSQEHGIVQFPESTTLPPIGSPLALLPIHSCLAAAALHAQYEFC